MRAGARTLSFFIYLFLSFIHSFLLRACLLVDSFLISMGLTSKILVYSRKGLGSMGEVSEGFGQKVRTEKGMRKSKCVSSEYIS